MSSDAKPVDPTSVVPEVEKRLDGMTVADPTTTTTDPAPATEKPIKTPADDADKPAEAAADPAEKPKDEAPVEAAAAAGPPAAAPATTDPAAVTTPAEVKGPTWPELAEDHRISKFRRDLPDILAKAEHNEVYGLHLTGDETDPTDVFYTNLILQKFLRANADNLDKAKEQLIDTLKWRKSFQPLALMDETFDEDKFGGLGYILRLPGTSSSREEIVTFNIYGAVKNFKKTFGDAEEFIRWRVALMERSIAALNLRAATEAIPDYGQGEDPYCGIQVHDYLNISFLRQDPLVKASSRKIIELFSRVYPETMSKKIFANVPFYMSWMFNAMRFLPAQTFAKLEAVTDGKTLKRTLGGDAVDAQLPQAYGGSAPALEKIAETPKLAKGGSAKAAKADATDKAAPASAPQATDGTAAEGPVPVGATEGAVATADAPPSGPDAATSAAPAESPAPVEKPTSAEPAAPAEAAAAEPAATPAEPAASTEKPEATEAAAPAAKA